MAGRRTDGGFPFRRRRRALRHRDAAGVSTLIEQRRAARRARRNQCRRGPPGRERLLRHGGRRRQAPLRLARRPGRSSAARSSPDLLAGRQAFQFRDLGAIELKGIAAAGRRVRGRLPARGSRARSSPTRRSSAARTKRLVCARSLSSANEGQGGLVMLVGEPGIGKTRTAEEFAEHARSEGAAVLWGRCYEGEWAPPYGPFAEAIAGYVRDCRSRDPARRPRLRRISHRAAGARAQGRAP